jgi:uncharacterized protein involved in response to NO
MALATHGQVTQHPSTIWPIFRLAFRPLFWLASIFSAFSVGLWALTVSGYVAFNPYGGSHFWHLHEMLFGFTVAVIAGFLLTAVQTWTRVPSVKGWPLAFLVLVWLLARVLMIIPSTVPVWTLVAVDLAFLPLSAFFLSRPIMTAKLWRNLFFVPVLLVMALLNAWMHASVLGWVDTSYLELSHVMVLMVTLVMCIMGGRVFPMFTANGTQTERVAPIMWLEKLSIGSVIACIVFAVLPLPLPQWVGGTVFAVAGVANFIRALRWRIWVTFKTPLVWSLHISYWSVCIGLMMLAAVEWRWLGQASLAYHAITVGGIGLMILSMISRVSLGHTGRAIQVDWVMTTAFLLMVAALVSRVILPLFTANYLNCLLISATLWSVAYSLFALKYLPIVFAPRVDGADG